MYKEEELSQELYQLERALRRALFDSKEFKRLKKKIMDTGLAMHVVLLVMAQDKYKKETLTKRKKWKFKLSNLDMEFLKKLGIKW